MADGKLYSSALTYPTIQAVANAKLGLLKRDELMLNLKTAQLRFVGRRQSTSDPWQIEVISSGATSELRFSKADVSIGSDQLGWKAMADLVLKAHQRPGDDQTWAFTTGSGHPVPFVVADATTDTGYRPATVAEISNVLRLEVQESGDMAVVYKPDGTTILTMPSIAGQAVATAIYKIISNTTDTTKVIKMDYCVISDTGSGNGAIGSSIGATYTLDDIKGTDGLSVGNYSGGDLMVELWIPAYNGLKQMKSNRKLPKGAVISVPSLQLDKLRKASAANQHPLLSVRWMSDTDSFTVETTLDHVGGTTGTDYVMAYASVANPEGVYEVDFDQANSIDVLATAAFAGVGGLVAVGTQASLEQLLSESFLSTTFGQIAVSLGTTTTALISGYVSALIAAFTNNWITSDQLFDLQNHVTWLKQGAANIAMAAGAGIAVSQVPNLLSFLGVSNNVLSMAMNAVGGAATSAGVALGMASVMSKVVRHTYWGE